MKRRAPSWETTVSAFRDLTATSVEGDATRARVLDRVAREAHRRGLARRGALALAIVLLIVSSGAALTAAVIRWRLPAPMRIPTAESDVGAAGRGAAAGRIGRAQRTIPPRPMASASDPSPDHGGGERVAYDRAHRAHFFAEQPAIALAAWDEYLAAYPRGAFVPEARYNRALCLVRLGRTATAAQALRPFATGRLAGYRRHEACLLLRWLSDRGGPAVEPSCSSVN